MIDATAKGNPGVFFRGLMNTGNEEECLQVNHLGVKNGASVKGSFSLLKILLPEGALTNYEAESLKTVSSYFYHEVKDFKTLRKMAQVIFGLCHPHTCSVKDLSVLIDSYLGNKFNYQIISTNRSLKRTPSNTQQVSLVFIFSLIAFTIASTIKYNVSKSFPIGSPHFDIIYNACSVIRRYRAEDQISRPTDFINGWKSIYLFGAIFFHMILHIEISVNHLNIQISKYLLSFPVIASFISRYSIETMCINVCSTAIVAAVTILPMIESLGASAKLFPLITLARYLRLLPLLAFSIMIVIVSPMFPFHNSGIFHPYVTQTMSDKCSTYWWGEALMISNFFPVDKICFGVGWFLSSDFQLSMLTFPLLLTLTRDWRKGIKLCFAYVIFGIAMEFIVLLYYNDFLIPQFHQESSYETFMVHHGWTTNYISPYSIGLVCGTLMYRDIRLPDDIYEKHYISLYAIIFMGISFVNTTDINEWKYFQYFTLLIASLLRTIAALGSCTLLYMVWMAKNSIIKRVLTFSPLFNTCARILLPSFLCHALVLTWMSSLLYSNSIDFNWFRFLERGFVAFPISIISGLCLHILVELPFMKLLKSLLVKKGKNCN